MLRPAHGSSGRSAEGGIIRRKLKSHTDAKLPLRELIPTFSSKIAQSGLAGGTKEGQRGAAGGQRGDNGGATGEQRGSKGGAKGTRGGCEEQDAASSCADSVRVRGTGPSKTEYLHHAGCGLQAASRTWKRVVA